VPKSAPRLREVPTPSPALPRNAGERKPTYAKVFRWQLPADQTVAPKTVEIIGSFTDWQRVPLRRDDGRDSWETTVPDTRATARITTCCSWTAGPPRTKTATAWQFQSGQKSNNIP